MPIYNRKDKKGNFFQFGKTGHKYYYYDKKSMLDAYNKVIQQMRAIKYNQSKK